MLRCRGITATIPQPSTQIAGRKGRGAKDGRPPTFDKERYKQRNTVERAINKFRERRAVATRTDKRDFVYRGTIDIDIDIDIASIRIWTRDLASFHSRDGPRSSLAAGGNDLTFGPRVGTRAMTCRAVFRVARWGHPQTTVLAYIAWLTAHE